MKTTLFTFLALAFLLSSCSDDPVSEQIVGTWDLQSVEATGCDDPEDNVPFAAVDDNNCITADGDTVCNFFFSFSADGTATQTLTHDGDTETQSFTYTTNDDNNTVIICQSTDCETITVDGDSFTLTLTDVGCISSFVFKKA